MPEKLLVVASKNPVKARAVRDGFARMFSDRAIEVESISVPSGVDNQPRSDDDTRRGAENRARAAAEARPDANFWFGLEGGVADDGNDLVAFAWIVVCTRDDAGDLRFGASRTASFALPHAVTALVRAGKELGEANDLVFGCTNSKHHGGAVGLLTGEVIDRADVYEQSVVLALIPFREVSFDESGVQGPDVS